MRLIDADKCPCKECLSEFHCNNTYCAQFEEWLQKPVYDIDKVVEEITKLRNDAYSYAWTYDDEFYDGQSDGLDKAIEIVKQQA